MSVNINEFSSKHHLDYPASHNSIPIMVLKTLRGADRNRRRYCCGRTNGTVSLVLMMIKCDSVSFFSIESSAYIISAAVPQESLRSALSSVVGGLAAGTPKSLSTNPLNR